MSLLVLATAFFGPLVGFSGVVSSHVSPVAFLGVFFADFLLDFLPVFFEAFLTGTTKPSLIAADFQFCREGTEQPIFSAACLSVSPPLTTRSTALARSASENILRPVDSGISSSVTIYIRVFRKSLMLL